MKENSKIRKELMELKCKNAELEKDSEVKNKTIFEINKELTRLKKAKKEVEKRYDTMEQYANQLKK